MALQPAADLEAVQARHHDVEQHQVDIASLRPLDHLGAVGDMHDIELAGERSGDDQGVCRLVVGDENAWVHG